MWSREDLAHATPPSALADLAEMSMRLLAESDNSVAFGCLVQLTRLGGKHVGVAAWTLAQERSWSQKRALPEPRAGSVGTMAYPLSACGCYAWHG
jgi:hypothetical protein